MENPTSTDTPNQTTPNKPNIILITVDQMRFPMDLPPKDPANPNVKLTPNEFVERYMPNLWLYLWKDGVKFSNYYTAASDCTAARATIHTGLYAYQTYSMLTLITYPPDEPTQPILDPAFPTIGKLMQQAGYQTPYFGKWHLSYDTADLTDYGYTSNTPNQDYVGYAGQGYATDDTPAWEAAHWINDYVRTAQTSTDPNSTQEPFFLTLNFVNPHDKQWFWGAMQATDFYEVYRQIPTEIHQNPPGPYIDIPSQSAPPDVYNTTNIRSAITNYEDQVALNAKPATQTLIKEVFQYQMGGIYEPDLKDFFIPVNKPAGFYYGPARAHQPNNKAVAPESYWVKALNSYVNILGQLDKAIGNFMRSISDEVRQNTVFIFTSDHGEYGSSHGLQGKGGTVYEEGIRVPLIVRDSSNGLVNDPNTVRNQLTSSVDLLPMIVTIGNGSTAWRTGDYQQLYGSRCDLLRILHEPTAPGRTVALHSTDEFIPETYNFNQSKLHVIGQITCDTNGANKKKLGIYTTWKKDDSLKFATVEQPTRENVEFYNFSTQPGEVASSPYDSSEVQSALTTLFGTTQQPGKLYTELQAPLPNQTLRDAQTSAYDKMRAYMLLVDDLAAGRTPPIPGQSEDPLNRLLARAWAF